MTPREPGPRCTNSTEPNRPEVFHSTMVLLFPFWVCSTHLLVRVVKHVLEPDDGFELRPRHRARHVHLVVHEQDGRVLKLSVRQHFE